MAYTTICIEKLCKRNFRLHWYQKLSYRSKSFPWVSTFVTPGGVWTERPVLPVSQPRVLVSRRLPHFTTIINGTVSLSDKSKRHRLYIWQLGSTNEHGTRPFTALARIYGTEPCYCHLTPTTSTDNQEAQSKLLLLPVFPLEMSNLSSWHF